MQQHDNDMEMSSSSSNSESIEEARSYFERLLLSTEETGSTSSWTTEEQQAQEEQQQSLLLLSSAARYRRQLEIQLLESLADNDDAVDELMHLWMFETTIENGKHLQDMEDACSPGLVQERKLLQDMIQEYPNWVEPKVRLATLLYFKGQTNEPYQLAEEAFASKPYHFEICPLLIMLSLRQQKFGLALRWARKGLPTLRNTDSSRSRREKWVHEAVMWAQTQLDRADVMANSSRCNDEPWISSSSSSSVSAWE